MKRLICSLMVVFIFSSIATASKEVPFTLDDKDRLIKVEEGLRSVHQRIDSVEKRIDHLQQLIYILIGAVIAQTIGVIGFVLCYRRSALRPV